MIIFNRPNLRVNGDPNHEAYPVITAAYQIKSNTLELAFDLIQNRSATKIGATIVNLGVAPFRQLQRRNLGCILSIGEDDGEKS